MFNIGHKTSIIIIIALNTLHLRKQHVLISSKNSQKYPKFLFQVDIIQAELIPRFSDKNLLPNTVGLLH